MIGGIVVATLLTLLFLPALYVAWYKIREPKKRPHKAKAKDRSLRQRLQEIPCRRCCRLRSFDL